jgi:Uma2 family endonuclease
MSTAPSPAHQLIVLEIIAILREQLVITGWGIVPTAPVGLFMPGCEPMQPDILAIRTADQEMIGARGVTGVPALLVEVLLPANAEYDLVIKRAAYARAGVLEYWVACPAEHDFLIHSEPERATGQYLRVEHVPATGQCISPTLPVRFAVAECFAGV